jgi:hypothetical protein
MKKEKLEKAEKAKISRRGIIPLNQKSGQGLCCTI